MTNFTWFMSRGCVTLPSALISGHFTLSIYLRLRDNVLKNECKNLNIFWTDRMFHDQMLQSKQDCYGTTKGPKTLISWVFDRYFQQKAEHDWAMKICEHESSRNTAFGVFIGRNVTWRSLACLHCSFQTLG